MQFNIFNLSGIDSGFGYSARDAMLTGKYKKKGDVPVEEMYPYDKIDIGTFDDSMIACDYDEFKEIAQKIQK